jgi:phosphoserine phosphatase
MAPAMEPCDDVRLIAFDVDGTLVENDHGLVVWQVLNERFVGDAALNAGRYRAFLAGTLSYAEWVRLDMEGWQSGGATRASIEQEIRKHLRLVPDARQVTSELRRRGYALAVISGTLDVVLDVLFPDHPFDHVFTNRIEFEPQGRICGWQATAYDMDGKADAVRLLSSRLGIAAQNIAFVGDNINDCAAMQLVGQPIAYDPKHERVSSLARHVLPRGGLAGLLELLPARTRAER